MSVHKVHSRELLDAFDDARSRALSARVWRVSWRTRDPLTGSPSGRWNSPGSMEALYTSMQSDGALAEVYHHLSLAPVRSSAEKLLYPLKVKTRKTLMLDTAARLRPFGLGSGLLTPDEVRKSQAVGMVAQLLGYDSLLVPSVRWNCLNLVLFPESIIAPGVLAPGKPVPVNWPAWRERNAKTLEALWARQRRARQVAR